MLRIGAHPLRSSSLRPVEAEIVIFCSCSVSRSTAATFRMPLASMSTSLQSVELRVARAQCPPVGTCSACDCPRPSCARPAVHESPPRFDCPPWSNKISAQCVGIVGIARNQHRHHSALRLDAQRLAESHRAAGCPSSPAQHAALNCRSTAPPRVGVYSRVEVPFRQTNSSRSCTTRGVPGVGTPTSITAL